MVYFVCLAVGYLIGSFPTAYLFVKRKFKIDIRDAGSGNVGARNAYEVTRSPMIGLIILIIDSLKGILSVYLCSFFIGENITMTAACGGIGAITGHIFSPWLGFKGGRGLATTAGVMLMFGWIYIVIWLLFYFLFNIYLKQVNLSSIVASIVSPVVILLLPDKVVFSFFIPDAERYEIVFICFILSVIIIIGHHGTIKDFIRKGKRI